MINFQHHLTATHRQHRYNIRENFNVVLNLSQSGMASIIAHTITTRKRPLLFESLKSKLLEKRKKHKVPEKDVFELR